MLVRESIGESENQDTRRTVPQQHDIRAGFENPALIPSTYCEKPCYGSQALQVASLAAIHSEAASSMLLPSDSTAASIEIWSAVV